MSTAAYQKIDRVPTGIKGLDQILEGGFLKGGIYILMGAPGAGKTIMANEICFNVVAQGGRALYVTLLAETHDRLFAHLSELAFFNDQVIANSLLYLNGYGALEQEGLRGLMRVLRREIMSHKATMLVLDGMTTVEAIAENDLTYKQFLHELQIFAQTSSCTALLLTPRDADPAAYPGHTIVDGLLELSKQHLGPQAVREIEVHKFRGSHFLEGRHRFAISFAGVAIYPRIETTRSGSKANGIVDERRMDFDIPGIDSMLYGGLIPGSTTMFLGAPGSGKTVLGLHFLAAGARKGERGLYFGFYEQPQRLVYKANQIGLDFSGMLDQQLISLIWHEPLETIPDALAGELFETVRERNIARLFIDGLEGFSNPEIYTERLSRFFTALSNSLRELHVTTVFSVELADLFSPTISVPLSGVSASVDNIFFLRYVELRAQLHRLISIMKVRESAYQSSIREFQITADGIHVAPTFESAQSILTGIAQLIPYQTLADEAKS